MSKKSLKNINFIRGISQYMFSEHTGEFWYWSASTVAMYLEKRSFISQIVVGIIGFFITTL